MSDETKSAAEQEREMREHEREARERDPEERSGEGGDGGKDTAANPAPPGNIQSGGQSG
jgi:hypothetical protein